MRCRPGISKFIPGRNHVKDRSNELLVKLLTLGCEADADQEPYCG